MLSERRMPVKPIRACRRHRRSVNLVRVADPATLTSLAGLVLALGKAWRDDDFGLDAEGWALLKDFVSTAPKLVQMFGGEPDP
jgi:hypothetical protein